MPLAICPQDQVRDRIFITIGDIPCLANPGCTACPRWPWPPRLTPSLGAAQTSDKLRIGMTVSSTGSFALASQSGVRGVELWVDDVNRRGGIEIKGKKYPVELVKLDDRSDKQMVTRVYERLIVDEKWTWCSRLSVPR